MVQTMTVFTSYSVLEIMIQQKISREANLSVFTLTGQRVFLKNFCNTNHTLRLNLICQQDLIL